MTLLRQTSWVAQMLASNLLYPQDAPSWRRQFDLERGTFRDSVDSIRAQRGLEADASVPSAGTTPTGLMADWLPRVAETIRQWVRAVGESKAPKPIAWPYLAKVDPFVLGAEAVRSILDGMTTERMAITALAAAIGRASEYELMVREWEARSPDSLPRPEDFGAGWRSWDEEARLRVGLALADCVMRATGWFELMPDPSYVRHPGDRSGPKLTLVVKPDAASWMAERDGGADWLDAPLYRPTVIPPRPWAAGHGGGYWTAYCGTPRLVPALARPETTDCPVSDKPAILATINHRQDVPWRINRRVLAVAAEAWGRNMAIAGLPLDEPLERLAALPDPEADIEAYQVRKRAASETTRRNMKRVAEVLATKRVLGIASEFEGFEEVFFPLVMDFRGECHPAPLGLRPDGSDLACGLLELAHGNAATAGSGGLASLASHLAGYWGAAVGSFDGCVAWAREREPLWRRIAADPLGSREWAGTRVSQPWCCLAAIIEYAACLDTGPAFVSRRPAARGASPTHAVEPSHAKLPGRLVRTLLDGKSVQLSA